MPVDTTTDTGDKQTVVGPDGKDYKFSKKISPDRIDKYFQKQGWVKKDGKWFTQSGELAQKGIASQVPSVTEKGSTTGRVGLTDTSKVKSNAARINAYGGTAMPSIMGGAGGMLGGPAGAFAGGIVGNMTQDIGNRILYDKEITNKEEVIKSLTEGAKQAGLEYVGGKVGDAFFNLLNKIPHAVVKEGIKLLPSDLNPSGKVMKYVEDLLTNLGPSARTMDEFKAKQSQVIIGKVEKMIQGFSKFNGTSEEMGVLLQNALRSGRDAAEDNIDQLRRSLPKGKQTTANMMKLYPDVMAKFNQEYENELVRQVIKTNKPELIAGLLRSSKASLNETRILGETLRELDPSMLGKVQNRIMRDVLSETLTGSKDPTVKGVQNLTGRFSGNKFKDALDNITEERLKAIYGETKYEAIEKFVKLTGTVGNTSSGSGVGRFLNLMFLVPFRSGITAKNLSKTAMLGAVFNRAAKVITSPEGVGIYENYIRAISSQSPRLINLAREEMNKFNERSDAEYKQEMKDAEEEYNKDKNK
jgi:hypothetical protein